MVMVKPALAYLDVIAAVRAAGRRAGGRLPRERRVRHGQGGGRAGLDRRAGGGPRAADGHQAGRRRRHPHLLRRRGGRGASVAERRRPAAERGDWFARARRSSPAGSTRRCGPSRSVGGDALLRGRGRRALRDRTSRAAATSTWSSPTGPSILGPRPPGRDRGHRRRRPRAGTTFGAPTPGEVLLAEAICARVPGCEQVRLVSSGTEATMSAVRLARGATGRDRVVKFAGCYHGHSDGLLAGGGSGVATLGLPGSAGVPAGAVADTVVVPYNVVPELDDRGGLRHRRAGGRQHGPGARRRPGSWRGCGPPATRSGRCSSSTR